MSNKMTGMKKVTAIMLVLTVGVFQSLIMSTAMAQVAPKLAGDLSIKGSVTLNGVNTANGATVFDGGRIKTGSSSGVIINFGRQGQIELGADTELVLKLDATTLGGNLRSGQATVSTPAGVGVNILTADGIAVGEGKEASVITVDVACGNTRVNSSRSEARVTAGNRIELVAAGQEVAVGSQDTGDPKRCPRLARARENSTTALTGGALAALILVGLGGAIAGVIAATQGDSTSSNTSGPLSNFRP
ncbi:MAG: hypothetical protein JST84_18725 [Acidobacteria bacterium]|nr:hypothetical protein [Acidobacteriota bacterium]